MGVVLGVFCKFFGMPQRGGLCVMYLGGVIVPNMANLHNNGDITKHTRVYSIFLECEGDVCCVSL